MASNYSKNLYDDYEKAQLKLDAILLELCNIKKEHRKELNKITKEDYKERYEILKKYQAFLKAQREKK